VVQVNNRQKDPTMTVTIRNKAVSQINRRFNNIKRVIKETLVGNNILDNIDSSQLKAAPKSRFQYKYDSDKIDEFIKWLREQFNEEILKGSTTPRDNWLIFFIDVAYKRGASKLKYLFDKKSIFKGSIYTHPIHVERSGLLFTRVYSQLKGVTDTMEQQISHVLSDGMIKGKNPKIIADEMSDRVEKIGKVRSRLIARTEIVRAHNIASINEAEILESSAGEKVKLIWQTALDGRERPSHRRRHRKVYDKDEAMQLIGEPNCRCSVTAWFDEFGQTDDVSLRPKDVKNLQ